MGGTAEKAKGRLKEAAGALTDDDELRREGKLDQTVGKAKDAADKVVDAARDAAEKVADKTRDVVDAVRRKRRVGH